MEEKMRAPRRQNSQMVAVVERNIRTLIERRQREENEQNVEQRTADGAKDANRLGVGEAAKRCSRKVNAAHDDGIAMQIHHADRSRIDLNPEKKIEMQTKKVHECGANNIAMAKERDAAVRLRET